MPLYCTMVNACGQIGGYPIPSYRIPVAYVEHAEVPSALSARPSSWPDGRGLRNTKGTVSVCAALLKDAMARAVSAAQRSVRPLCRSMQLIERPFRRSFATQ